jgi:chromosome partitioning protein
MVSRGRHNRRFNPEAQGVSSCRASFSIKKVEWASPPSPATWPPSAPARVCAPWSFENTLSYSLRTVAPSEFIVATPHENLDLMHSSPALGELQGKLESRHKIYKLREALQQLANDYDRIYIDTPPALNFYTRSALIAARACLIPFDCDDFSRKALYTLLENVQEIQADHNPQLVVEGIVVNQFQPRANLPQRLVDELIAEGLPVLQPYLPSSVKIRESHEQSLPMIYLDPGHKLTQALVALHETLG